MAMAMTMRLYDPIQAIKRLHKAGVQKEMAEAFVEEIRASQESSLEDLATKQDIKDVKNEIELLKQETKNEATLIRSEIRNAMLMTIISLGGIIALIEKFIK